MRLADIGLTSRGAGADNIRNITGSPTAGIDPQELIDTRPLCTRAASFHSAPSRALRPAAQIQHRLRRRRTRRGAGGYQRHRVRAVRVADGFGDRAGRVFPARARRHHRPPRFRARHRRDRAAGRRVRVAQRHRARVHRAWRSHRPHQGAAEIRARPHGVPRASWRRWRKSSAQPLLRVDAAAIAAAPAQDKHGHVGVHPQKQAGLNLCRHRPVRWRGSAADSMRGLADIAERSDPARCG